MLPNLDEPHDFDDLDGFAALERSLDALGAEGEKLWIELGEKSWREYERRRPTMSDWQRATADGMLAAGHGILDVLVAIGRP
jgi:hypothetical protein